MGEQDTKMILAEISRERSEKKKVETPGYWKIYMGAGDGLQDLVTRKSGKDRKDPGQPLVETKVSRTKKLKRGRSTETE